MRIMGTNRGRAGLTIAIAALAVTSISLTAWYLTDENDWSVEGGYILGKDTDSMTVRCLSANMSLHLSGFTGRIELTNCFPDAQIDGYDGEVLRNGTSLSLWVSGGTDTVTIRAPQKESFKFAVLGDSQGKNDVLARILDSIEECEFVIHCGDLTPSGADSEFEAVEEALSRSHVPVFTAPGNHDARQGDLEAYESGFGPAEYSFTYSGIGFAFIDSSDQSISEDELERAQQALGEAQTKIMVTHVPSYDPFNSNHTLDSLSCERVQSFALENDIAAVYSGHVHAYYLLEVEGTDFLITGGAGGTLVNGTHHHVVVSAGPQGLSYGKVDLVDDWARLEHVSLTGRDGQVLNLTSENLREMDIFAAYSSFENQFYNIRGAGTYSGHSIASLVELVGGMEEGDVLRVVSSDGYSQEFGYLNVYPDEEWSMLQGTMVLALECDGVATPDWEDGPRLVFLAPDGLYSNSDCEATSYEGQGFYLYPSAGARWVSYASSIVVEASA